MNPFDENLRILLADDHALVRSGLSLLIRTVNPNTEVIEKNSYDETAGYLANDSSVDLLLIDLHMPGSRGLEGIKYICDSYPDVPLAIISVAEDTRIIRSALQLGAVGYIPKTSSPEVTISAIQLVLSGGIYVPPHVLASDGAPDLNKSVGEAFPKERGPLGPSAEQMGITKRQKEVLDLLAEGKPNKEIAKLLGLTPGTVKMHTSRLFKLLNVSNRTEAVAKYTRLKNSQSVA